MFSPYHEYPSDLTLYVASMPELIPFRAKEEPLIIDYEEDNLLSCYGPSLAYAPQYLKRY